MKKPEKVRPPEFVVKPRRQFIDEGQGAKFKVSFDGSPATLTWSKDGKQVVSNSKIKIYEQDGYHFLEILSVQATDSGIYIGTVENSAGTDTASAELDVFGECRYQVLKIKISPCPSSGKYKCSKNNNTHKVFWLKIHPLVTL